MKPTFIPLSSFEDFGGWTLDSQFIDQMGGAYLLAHGLGRPVADAVGRIVRLFDCSDCSRDQRCENVRVWVRTRDWCGGAGRFVVKIGDWTSKELGVGESEWHWEDCGVVELPEGEVEIRLHDLTGFEGRCAGVALTEVDFTADDFVIRRISNDALRNTADGKSISSQVSAYDFVVVGGGYAGMCAAVAAARQGVKTCLVHDRPVFGGNGSNEVRVGPIGRVGLKPFPRNSDLAYELMALTKGVGKTSGGLRPFFDDAKLEAWLAAEKNLTVFKNARCVGVVIEDGNTADDFVIRRISNDSVCLRPAEYRGRQTRIVRGSHDAPQNAVDDKSISSQVNACHDNQCEEFLARQSLPSAAKQTGEGKVVSPKFCAREATAVESILVLDVLTGEKRKINGKLFADCTGDAILAELAGAELRTKPEEGESLKGEYGSTNFWTTRWTERETPFPACPWALKIDETNCNIARPKSEVEGDYPFAAGWNWESGFGKDAIKDGEWIRDYNFRAAYGMWDYLKNRSPEKERYAKAEMDWLGFVLGKRAARRIVGDYVLTEKDLTEHREYEDGVVTTTWFLDLHLPHPQNEKAFPEGAFRSIAFDDPRYDVVGDRTKGGYRNIRPYAIPYRCFYSKNVANMFMAGKDISATHVAMASVRVENTCAQMGAMVGRAAALCVKNGWTPRQLGAEHFGVLAKVLRNPGPSTRLARQGQGRIGVKGEVRYWLRVGYHKMKKLLGCPYLEELAG